LIRLAARAAAVGVYADPVAIMASGDPIERVVLEVTVDEAERHTAEVQDALAIRIAEAVAARLFGS
jgi:hypothetical protein